MLFSLYAPSVLAGLVAALSVWVLLNRPRD